MIRAFVAAGAAILLVTGCSDHPTRVIADGYTLHGLVLDAGTGAPVSDASVWFGVGVVPEFHEIAVTDANGVFTLKPAPNTAPSSEIIRLTKPGYASLDVPANTAARVADYLYQLEIHLQAAPSP